MQNSTIANAIQQRTMMLIAKPNFPKLKVDDLTILRPRTTLTRMGMPYAQLRQMVATPVKELKAAVDPK